MGVKERILEAGSALLHQEGPKALTQPRIAGAAGVSQSHLTYYFRTRNDLLLAIARHSVEQALAQPLSGSGDDPVQSLAAAAGYLPRIRMLVGLALAADQEEELRDAIGKLVSHVRQGLGQLLRRLGYRNDHPQVVLFHAAVVGLATQNLGRQSPESEADIEIGLRTLLSLLPRSAPPVKEIP